ncbi:MAG TPA: SseB family protein [Streptosporangiaceae bacterium]|nr:SseB family protein [Streptosporangiaceae bacterium]
MLHGSDNPRFRDDDGSADPAVAAALSAFAAAQGSEHDTLTALSRIRLLVPVVAVLSDEDGQEPSPSAGGEKNSEMAMPTLVGRDGRAAIPVFTGLDALARWQPAARPVPAEAVQVWQAAVQESCAVIVDVAGPVPLAIEGARLAALAQGQPAPLPHEDPDVHAVVAALVAEATDGAAPASFTLRPAPGDADLLIELTPAPGLDPAAVQAFASQVGSGVLERLGYRLRRGIALALAQS